jgi:hypothetical protein
MREAFRTSTDSWRFVELLYIYIQAHTQTVIDLIRHKFRIDTRLAGFVIDSRKRPIPEMRSIGPIKCFNDCGVGDEPGYFFCGRSVKADQPQEITHNPRNCAIVHSYRLRLRA